MVPGPAPLVPSTSVAVMRAGSLPRVKVLKPVPARLLNERAVNVPAVSPPDACSSRVLAPLAVKAAM